MSNQGKLPVPHRISVLRATRAETDEQLLQSWLKSLSSPQRCADIFDRGLAQPHG
jgi:hypothetical protein